MRTSLTLLAAALLLHGALAAELVRDVTVSAGDLDRTNAVVRLPLVVPTALRDATVRLTDGDGTAYAAQLLSPRLLAAPTAAASDLTVARELLFVVPRLAKGATLQLKLRLSDQVDDAKRLQGFHWTDTPGVQADLLYGDRPVVRYQKLTYEPKDKDKRLLSYKVFHHVFDPATGKLLLTKGPGGGFTHHRGIFFGFNKVTYELDGKKKSCDIWHCPKAWQEDAGTLLTEAGPVAGRQRVAIDWHGEAGDIFAKETRELTVLNLAGGTLIEWATRLASTGPTIKLDGDPQHAGFHFRANNEVHDKTAKQTYYLRPDGKDKLDATRNWPGNKQHINLPWDVMSFVTGDQRYSVEYIDRPENPKEARFSERDYGRFGSYYVVELKPDKPLELCYRLWIASGELTGAQAAALSADFVTPAAVK